MVCSVLSDKTSDATAAKELLDLMGYDTIQEVANIVAHRAELVAAFNVSCN